MLSVKEKTQKAIEEFNKYRAPEATAKLISINERTLNIEFTGPFCRACGFNDYFDDLVVFAEELDLKIRIAEINEMENGAMVKFEIG